jgi:hypothetical protein
MAEGEIRDLLYLDFEKAASIWSQFEGGLRQQLSITKDESKEETAGVRFGIPKVAEASLGVDYAGKRSILESKVLHHDILQGIDSALTETGLVVDLMRRVSPTESDPQSIRDAIGMCPYIKAAGTSVIEDYSRILSISERFNDIVGFVSQCAMQTSPDFLRLQNNLTSLRAESRTNKERNKKAVLNQKLQAAEKNLQLMLESNIGKLDEWLIDGIKMWITTFMPTRINFRVYPFPSCPSFQIICNLKRDCFVDQDAAHLLYGYGNRPNVPLAVFGLLTSIPEPDSDTEFDPLEEFNSSNNESSEQVVFEKAFRELFGAMDNIEAFMRYSRYPNVTVHPIAVYRSFVPLAE